MPEVLAAVVEGRNGTAVLHVARAVAALMRARVRRLVLSAAPGAPTAEAVLAALADTDALVAVLTGEADPAGASWRVMAAAAKPLVLLPPGLRADEAPIGRVLVPLDGSRECAHAVEHTIELCTRAGVDLVVLHVFGPGTAPPYWDQSAHALKAWGEEFLLRHVTAPGVRLEVRVGAADENVLDVAESLGADLIALGWSQRLDDGRAQTVRRSVVEARVPVMLVPVGEPDDAHEEPHAPALGRSALLGATDAEVS
jgi:nucleotide-binding universal stress UspA family protein